MMHDVVKLKSVIDESGMKMNAIASKMGITRAALYLKLNGATEFKISEVLKLAEILHLTDNQRDAIFLPSKSTE